MIHHIQFAVLFDPEPPWKKDEVQIRIDGRNFREWIREVELPFATAEGHPTIAGQYVGLPPKSVCPPSRHFLGMVSEGVYQYEFRTQILQCECGEPGCWPLLCRIEVGPFIVSWSDFQQPHRYENGPANAWSYEKLGPFEFERLQYEEALEELGRSL